jgi:hypothetical protein
MTFPAAALFSTVKNVEIQQRHIPPPQGAGFKKFQGFGLDSRTSCNPKTLNSCKNMMTKFVYSY